MQIQLMFQGAVHQHAGKSRHLEGPRTWTVASLSVAMAAGGQRSHLRLVERIPGVDRRERFGTAAGQLLEVRDWRFGYGVRNHPR